MEGPSISVVICTYNNAATLVALRHLAGQRDTDGVSWDILVVDNNCTDRTRDLVYECAASMPVPCRVVTEREQGVNPARVAGARHSAGAWIAFVDDDCMLEPDWIRQAGLFIADHPDAGAFGGQVILKWEHEPPPAYVAEYGYAFAETRLGDVALARDWLVGAGMVVRRTALLATGWLDGQCLEDRIGRRLVSGGDVELGLRIALQFEVWYAPRCVLHHSIPSRRTERRYLRRLVFGLGRSSHDVAVLEWNSDPKGWWRHAFGRARRLAADGSRKALADFARRRAASEPVLALAFAAGWATGMAAFCLVDQLDRGTRLGRLSRVHRNESRIPRNPLGAPRA